MYRGRVLFTCLFERLGCSMVPVYGQSVWSVVSWYRSEVLIWSIGVRLKAYSHLCFSVLPTLAKAMKRVACSGVSPEKLWFLHISSRVTLIILKALLIGLEETRRHWYGNAKRINKNMKNGIWIEFKGTSWFGQVLEDIMRRGWGCKEIKEKRLWEDRGDVDARRRRKKARTENITPSYWNTPQYRMHKCNGYWILYHISEMQKYKMTMFNIM